MKKWKGSARKAVQNCLLVISYYMYYNLTADSS